MRIQCEECGNRNIMHLDIEGFGEDELGEFVDYYCEECGYISRIYDDIE